MKLMRGAPISTRQQFSAGGSQVPIATRSSAQSVNGYQQMGTSVGKTTLGAYRMGDSDGIAPPSAIYPGDIFSPQPARDRKMTDVTFESVGNRTFQPADDESKLHALLKKFGDQQFKATESAPFEEYFRIQALARQADEASRFAGVEQVGQSREIIRNLADTRRQANEDDFMRRMLDAGMSMEDAQDEIDNVRRASALQESRTVDDRPYQAKLLISRISQSRGLASQVKDPLSQSAAISNPQNSQDANLAMGKQDEGFGTNPVDVNRQFMTPDFYRRFGRRMPQSQEAQDSAAAVNYLISQGGAGDITNVAQVKGLERADQIQRQREFAAAKLETLRNRGTKIMLPLPPVDFFSESLLRQVYGNRKAGEQTYYTTEDSQTLTHTQAVVAMNQLLALDSSGRTYAAAKEFLSQYNPLLGGVAPNPQVFDILRSLVVELTGGSAISLPFVGKTISFSADSGNLLDLAQALESIKSLKDNPAARRSKASFAAEMDAFLMIPRGAGPPPPIDTRLATGSTAVADLIPGTNAPGVASAIAGLRQVEAQTAGRNAGRRRQTAVAGLRQVEADTSARNAARREAPRQPRAKTADFTVKAIKEELTRMGVPFAASANKDTLYALYVGNFQ